ncbi:MAG: site-2 protease family protein [Acidimicrobiia bacterium]
MRALKQGFRLGRIAGIDVTADFSLVVLGVLLVGSLFVDLRRVSPDSSRDTLLLAAAIGGVLFIGGVLAHELSHSILAGRRGLPVRRIRLLIFGGVSEIEREASDPGDEFAIAVAGPVASAALGGLLWLVALVVPGDWVLAGRLGRVLAVVNVLLALFNLLPGFPLDGGRALRALLWRQGDRDRATRIAIESGRFLALGLLGVGAWLVLRRRDVSGLWTIAVAWFLYRAAVGAAGRERLLSRIDGLTVGDVMRRVTESVPGDITVAEVVRLHQVGPELLPVPVEIEGRVRGVIGEQAIAALSEPARLITPVSEVMRLVGHRDVAPAAERLEDFLGRPAAPAGLVLAVADRRVVGVVTGREMGPIFSG